MEEKRTKRQKQKTRGTSILESVVAIGVASLLLGMIIGMFSLLRLQQSTVNRAIARQLLAEESEALRNASFLDLENRTNTPFIEVAYPAGTWTIQSPGTAISGANVLHVDAATGAANPSRQPVPLGHLDDGIYEANIRVAATSPAGWKVGMYFRYHDDQNYYLLRATSTQLEFLRVLDGTSSTLWSAAQAFSTNAWHELTLTAAADAFTVAFDGLTKTVTPVTDATFTNGAFVLGAFDGVTADYDDISFVGEVSVPWNFDGVDEQIGRIPLGWQRLAPSDLPSGATSVTITDVVPGFTDLKSVAATVTWVERGATRQLANTFYINQRSVAP